MTTTEEQPRLDEPYEWVLAEEYDPSIILIRKPLRDLEERRIRGALARAKRFLLKDVLDGRRSPEDAVVFAVIIRGARVVRHIDDKRIVHGVFDARKLTVSVDEVVIPYSKMHRDHASWRDDELDLIEELIDALSSEGSST